MHGVSDTMTSAVNGLAHRVVRMTGRDPHEPGRVATSLELLFDLTFVVVCVAVALLVRHEDFFTVGVLPPLLMLSTFLLLAMSRSEAIAGDGDGMLQAVVSGLAHHSVALVLAYALALATLVLRRRVAGLRESGGHDDLDEDALDGGDDPRDVMRSGPGPRLPV